METENNVNNMKSESEGLINGTTDSEAEPEDIKTDADSQEESQSREAEDFNEAEDEPAEEEKAEEAQEAEEAEEKEESEEARESDDTDENEADGETAEDYDSEEAEDTEDTEKAEENNGTEEAGESDETGEIAEQDNGTDAQQSADEADENDKTEPENGSATALEESEAESDEEDNKTDDGEWLQTDSLKAMVSSMTFMSSDEEPIDGADGDAQQEDLPQQEEESFVDTDAAEEEKIEDTEPEPESEAEFAESVEDEEPEPETYEFDEYGGDEEETEEAVMDEAVPAAPVFEEIFSNRAQAQAALSKEELYEKATRNMAKMETEQNAKTGTVSLFKISVAAVVAVIMLVAGVLVYSALNSKTPTENDGDTTSDVKIDPDEIDDIKFTSNIRVAGVSLENRTYETARKIMQKREKEILNKFVINIPYKDDVYTYTQDDFSYFYDTDDVLIKALEYSQLVKKEGKLVESDEYPDINNTSSGEKYVDFEVSYEIDDKSIEDVVTSIADKIEIEMVEPHVSKFNPCTDNRFVIANGKNGLSIDKDDLRNQITDAVKSGTTTDIKLITSVVKPTKRKSDIKKNTVLIGSYSTTSYNNADGNENMRLALSKINGHSLENGEVLSFNECTGDSNLPEGGWRPATVINNGKLETGYGGGICQAASTLYNAALKAVITIEERHNHLWPSSYVPTGLDATIDYPYLDLKLKNETGYTIYFECYMDYNVLNVNIYGHKDPSFDSVELSAWQTSTIDQPDNIYTIDYSKADNYYNVERYGNAGKRTAAMRTLYKNGKVVREDELPNSYYDAVATKITVGPGYDSNGNWKGGTSSKPANTSSSSPSSSRAPSSSSGGGRSSSSQASSSRASSSSPPPPSSTAPVSSEEPVISEELVSSEEPITSEEPDDPDEGGEGNTSHEQASE